MVDIRAMLSAVLGTAYHDAGNSTHVAPGPSWTRYTLYDVLQEDCRAGVDNNDVANVAGDLYFHAKDKYLPLACAGCKAHPLSCQTAARFDCHNPESTGNLVVRQLEVEVLKLGTYQLCDVWRGVLASCNYTCFSPSLDPDAHGVGAERVCGGGVWPFGHECGMAPHPIKHLSDAPWDYWNWNLAMRMGDTGGGYWYSLVAEDEGRYWRHARVAKAVNARCHNRRCGYHQIPSVISLGVVLYPRLTPG